MFLCLSRKNVGVVCRELRAGPWALDLMYCPMSLVVIANSYKTRYPYRNNGRVFKRLHVDLDCKRPAAGLTLTHGWSAEAWLELRVAPGVARRPRRAPP